jgi:hypothetical protein
MIEIKNEPTPRELAVFAALWAVFFPLLGWIAAGAGAGLLAFAGVAAACFLLTTLIDREVPLRERMIGVAAPATAIAVWALAWTVHAQKVDAATVRGALVGAGTAIGVLGCAGVLASRPAGVRLYRAWMLAMRPIGWTLSHAMLGLVFFGVIAPIGLLLRAARRDPLERSFKPAGESYWSARNPEIDARRYLRQF